jgi:hypothetical protein
MHLVEAQTAFPSSAPLYPWLALPIASGDATLTHNPAPGLYARTQPCGNEQIKLLFRGMFFIVAHALFQP